MNSRERRFMRGARMYTDVMIFHKAVGMTFNHGIRELIKNPSKLLQIGGDQPDIAIKSVCTEYFKTIMGVMNPDISETAYALRFKKTLPGFIGGINYKNILDEIAINITVNKDKALKLVDEYVNIGKTIPENPVFGKIWKTLLKNNKKINQDVELMVKKIFELKYSIIDENKEKLVKEDILHAYKNVDINMKTYPHKININPDISIIKKEKPDYDNAYRALSYFIDERIPGNFAHYSCAIFRDNLDKYVKLFTMNLSSMDDLIKDEKAFKDMKKFIDNEEMRSALKRVFKAIVILMRAIPRRTWHHIKPPFTKRR